MGVPSNRAVSGLGKNKSDLQFLFLLILLWSVPVVLTLLSGPQQNIVVSAIVAGVVSYGIIVFKPKISLIALPFFALLSPVAGFLNVFGVPILLSDLLFILFAIQFASLLAKRYIRIYRNSFYSLPGILLILFLFSIVVGTVSGMLTSFKPVLLLLQLIIIYFYTRTFARNEKSWSLVINAWVAATFFGALLLIQAFITGKHLANFRYSLGSELAGIENPETIDFLIQATYYYTTFHFVLGLSIIVLIFKLFFSKSTTKRLLILMPLGICLLALIILQNKTAIFSISLSILIFCILFFLKWNKKMSKTLIQLVLFFSLFFVFVTGGLFGYIGDIQAQLWIRRLISGSSFYERVENYLMAFSSWFYFPCHLLTGMGPDFLDSSGDNRISLLFKVSGENLFVGTIDSGWISYLIEMGIIGFTALALLFIMSIGRVVRHLKQIDPISLADNPSVYVLVGLFSLIVALCTQMLGYTKLAWFPFQLLIIGLMHKRYLSGPVEKKVV